MFTIAAWLSAAAVLAPAVMSAQAPLACEFELCRLIASGNFAELRWPDFRDYTRLVYSYYEQDGFRLSWFPNGTPTPQALRMIDVLKNSAAEGLDPEDYDGSRWTARLAALLLDDTLRTRSDVALTICVIRYLSDLHFGKFNPGLFHSRLDPAHQNFDIPAMVRELAERDDSAALLSSLEPPFRGYRETQAALDIYI